MAIKVYSLLVIVVMLFNMIILKVEAGFAHSFQHFHGPVDGDDKKVTWVDKYGKHHQDYVAPAHYEFAYGVEDRHTGVYHGQKEHRDDKAVAGEYIVKEPDGNIRTVRYHANEEGFHATVHNSHGNNQQGGDGSDEDER